MTRCVLLSCLCLVSLACTPKPEVWTSPALSLPVSAHAVSLSLKRLSMLSPSLSGARLEELAEECAERMAVMPIEPEVPEEEDPQPEQARTLVVKVPADRERRSAEITGASLSEVVAALPDTEGLGQDPPAELPELIPLPDEVLAPAVLAISLSEVTWMGKEVARLKDGVYEGSGGDLEIKALQVAVEASIKGTRAALEMCTRDARAHTPTALIAIDARVPLQTFNRGIYNLSLAGVETFALLVSDLSPQANRLSTPVGGKDRVGTLTATASELTWVGQAAPSGDTYQDEAPEAPSPPVMWPRNGPLPKHLGEASIPSVMLLVGTRSPVSSLVSLIDELAGMETYCVGLGLGPDEDAAGVSAPLGPSTTLRVDVRDTVTAHLVTLPFRGSRSTRIDGARCRRSWRLKLEAQLPEPNGGK